MNLKEAIDRGIPRVRRPTWANADAYLRLRLDEFGNLEQHLFSRIGQELFGLPTPQDAGGIGFALWGKEEDFVIYDGPLDKADLD